MIEKTWNASVEAVYSDKPKLTLEEQITYMRDKKGIAFGIISEAEALAFLQKSNCYFRIKAFAKNYSKIVSGPDKGKYYRLEFAYLQELSILDMHLREAVMLFSLDIEHFLKVRLLNDIAGNQQEDGYSIVDEFLERNPRIKDSIQFKARDSYCEEMINKYIKHFPVWAFVETLSFGDLINFCDLYYQKYPNKDIPIGGLRTVKFLRNAAAHNNCLIHNLRAESGKTFRKNREVSRFVAEIPGISANTRSKRMQNRTIHDLVVMLWCFRKIVTSESVVRNRLRQLDDLLANRFVKHAEYFEDDLLLTSSYRFFKKVVDKVVEYDIMLV